MTDALVAGGGVAALLSSLFLARRGLRVTLHCNERLGGHFAGVEACGRRFDPGMAFLESTSFAAQPGADPRSYDASVRNDVGRFTPLVARTLRELGIETRKVAAPEMRVSGLLLPDAIVANRLEGLRQLPVAGAALAELQAIVARGRGPLHAARKLLLADRGYDELSRANHGEVLHGALFRPLARKIAGEADPCGPYHRLAWLPLYHPETLLEALRGEPSRLPETIFELPVAGSLWSAIEAIIALVRAEPRICIDAGQPGASVWREAPLAIWAAPAEALLILAREQPAPLARAQLQLDFVLVPAAKLRRRASTLFVVDGPDLPYRISDQGFAAGSGDELAGLCLESRSEKEPRAALEELNLCAGAEVVAAERKRVPVPLATCENLRISSARDARLAELFPRVQRIGAAAPFGAASFNDQVVQALRAAAGASP